MASASIMPMNQPVDATADEPSMNGPSASVVSNWLVNQSIVTFDEVLTNSTCIHLDLFDVALGEVVAVDDDHSDLEQLVGLEAAQDQEVLVELVVALLEDRLALAPVLDEEVRAGLAIDVRVPNDLDGRHAVVHRHLVPRELRFIRWVSASVSRAPFNVIAVQRNFKLMLIKRDLI